MASFPSSDFRSDDVAHRPSVTDARPDGCGGSAQPIDLEQVTLPSAHAVLRNVQHGIDLLRDAAPHLASADRQSISSRLEQLTALYRGGASHAPDPLSSASVPAPVDGALSTGSMGVGGSVRQRDMLRAREKSI